MEVLPCSIHAVKNKTFNYCHNELYEHVGHCNACYIWAMYQSLKPGSYVMWGDIESYCDEYRESIKTPEQKAAEMVAKETAAKKMVVKAHLCHMENAFVNRKGTLKRIPVPCKYFCHKGEYGTPTPGGGIWVDGCEAHLKGICPAYHPDEREWAETVAADKARKSNKTGSWRRN